VNTESRVRKMDEREEMLLRSQYEIRMSLILGSMLLFALGLVCHCSMVVFG